GRRLEPAVYVGPVGTDPVAVVSESTTGEPATVQESSGLDLSCPAARRYPLPAFAGTSDLRQEPSERQKTPGAGAKAAGRAERSAKRDVGGIEDRLRRGSCP